MKVAKKRFYQKTPEFWKVLKGEIENKLDPFWKCDAGIKGGEMHVLAVGRRCGKSMLTNIHIIKMRNSESGEEKIL